MNIKYNQIHYYCSWILSYILSKAIILEQNLAYDLYLVEDIEKAIKLLKKLEQKMNMDDKFIQDYSQFCIYVSAIRHKIHTNMTWTEKWNKENNEKDPFVFSSQDLILIDRLLNLLYDIYKKIDKLDKDVNVLFVFAEEFSGSIDLRSSNYEITITFENDEHK